MISGTFGARTAVAILEGGERRGLAPLGIDVESGLQQLAAASLLRREDEGRAYAMLTTVRADAQDRLARSGEGVAMRWAHAYQVLAVAEEAEQALPTGRDLEALDRLEEAHDDIREALEWAMEQGDGTFALRLAGTLADFWRTRGHHTEGRLRLAAALSMAVDPPPPVLRKALSGAGLLASYQGDYRLGEAYLREALAIAREAGDEEAMAANLNWLGTNAYGSGDLDAAEAWISESLEIRRRIGDPAGIALALNALGGVHHFRGDLDSARAMFVESFSLKEGLGNTNGIAVALTNLGLVERDAGDPEAAARAFQEAIDIWERLGDRQRLAVGVHNAALLDLDRGRLDEAAVQLGRAYDIASGVGDRTEMAYAMADRVRVDVERGELDGAGQALAARCPAPMRSALGSSCSWRSRARPRGRGAWRRRARAAPVGRGRRGSGRLGVREHAGRRAARGHPHDRGPRAAGPGHVAAAWAEGQALTLRRRGGGGRRPSSRPDRRIARRWRIGAPERRCRWAHVQPPEARDAPIPPAHAARWLACCRVPCCRSLALAGTPAATTATADPDIRLRCALVIPAGTPPTSASGAGWTRAHRRRRPRRTGCGRPSMPGSAVRVT